MLPSGPSSPKTTSVPSNSTSTKDSATIHFPHEQSGKTLKLTPQIKEATSYPPDEKASSKINTQALHILSPSAKTIHPIAKMDEDLILFNTPVYPSLITLDDIKYRRSMPFIGILTAASAFMRIPPRIVEKNIILRPVYPMIDSYDLDLINLWDCDLKNMNLSKEEGKGIIVHFASILARPRELLKRLEPIEQALSLELDKKGIVFTEADDPSFLFEGPGLWILGPKKQDAEFKSKGRILDQVLLKAEQSLGLNEQGSPTFVGFVDSNLANSFVEEGNIFKEDVSVSRLLLHGKHTHRLAILALIESLKGTPFEGVSPKTLLKLLIRAKIGKSQAWTYLLDTNTNITSIAPNSSTFNYNCRSPFILQSLILCFGSQLGVPHLMHCLRDSFWKSANQMIEKIQKSNLSSEKISKAAIYTMIMKEFLTIGQLHDIGQPFSFSKPRKIAALDPKYQDHPSGIPGIKVKESKENELDFEKSKQNIFAVMRNQGTLIEMIHQPETYAEIISEFLERDVTLEELAQIAPLFTSSDLTPIFNEIVEKRCQTLENKLLFLHSLIEQNLNNIAVKFINTHFEELNEQISDLKEPQKGNLFKAAVIEGLLDVVKKILDSRFEINQKDPEIGDAIHTAITRGHQEVISFLTHSHPELLKIRNSNKQTVADLIKKNWNPKK